MAKFDKITNCRTCKYGSLRMYPILGITICVGEETAIYVPQITANVLIMKKEHRRRGKRGYIHGNDRA